MIKPMNRKNELGEDHTHELMVWQVNSNIIRQELRIIKDMLTYSQISIKSIHYSLLLQIKEAEKWFETMTFINSTSLLEQAIVAKERGLIIVSHILERVVYHQKRFMEKDIVKRMIELLESMLERWKIE